MTAPSLSHSRKSRTIPLSVLHVVVRFDYHDGHFTEMVWASTHLVGCGLSHYKHEAGSSTVQCLVCQQCDRRATGT